jgi:hypothetical protein
MSISAIPPAAGIQIREVQDEAAGDGFCDRCGRWHFDNARGGRYSRFVVTEAL